jgi:hypothetical protein
MAHWQCFLALLCYGIAMLAVGVGSSESARSLKTIEQPDQSSPRFTSPYATSATQLLPQGSATLFVGTLDGRVAALDWRTGLEKWSYATQPTTQQPQPHPHPSSSSIPTSESSGASEPGEGVHWEGTARAMMFASSSPTIVPSTDGVIYFNSPNGLARHPLTAAEIIRRSPFTPPEAIWGEAESSGKNSVVYLGHKKTSFFALHPDFGLLKTFASMHGADGDSAALLIEEEAHVGIGAKDVVHVSRNDYCVAAVDLTTGYSLF